MDGHFIHGTWTWSTSGSSAKARHLEARPAVSIARVDDEDLAVFAHGKAERLGSSDPWRNETLSHWTAHYGGSPLEWGDDIRLYRLAASWMVGYAADRKQLVMSRGRHGPCSVSFFLVHNQPGQGPRFHHHPYDETFLILDGRVRVTVGEETIEGGPGDIVIGPAEAPHGLTNLGPGRPGSYVSTQHPR